ncbi:hypothetical protein [Bacteroides pyogenes]|jgi:hypothetical protein|uniref:Uncharacterized protein n=1 Tax=Bacteroides pyogenes TaxID=310300 RepID=A0A5D3EA70_9BACE|nr:hypothetical protein [Bacteroides pyogenes]TYK32852.1 hypothetical protein FNJ60_10605 [Bacteroides pyogenes]
MNITLDSRVAEINRILILIKETEKEQSKVHDNCDYGKCKATIEELKMQMKSAADDLIFLLDVQIKMEKK